MSPEYHFRDSLDWKFSVWYDESKEGKEGEKYLRQERRYGKYPRSFNLGDNVDEAKIIAEFDKGVLSLQIPKGGMAPETRTIPIK